MKQTKALKQAVKFCGERRRKLRWHKVLSGLAAVVVFCTTYALILPAITMETAPVCGLEEHTHSDSCYETVLACGLEESEDSGHVHDDSCYEVTTSREMTCGQDECEAVEGHSHSDSCYTTETRTVSQTVTVEDGTEEVVVGQDEEGNDITELQTRSHEETQEYEEEYQVLSCGQSESDGTPGHSHSDSCYEDVETRSLTCGQAEGGHSHSDSCYEQRLTCGLEEHTHSDACRAKDDDDFTVPGSSSETPDASTGDSSEITGDGSEIIDSDLPAADSEGYLIDADGNRILDENGEPILAQPVEPVEPEEPVVDLEEVVETGMVALPYDIDPPVGYDKEYICVDPESSVAVKVYATEGAFPAELYGEDLENLQLVAEILSEGSAAYEDAASALDEDSYDGMVALDIRFEINGVEVEPLETVYVVINALGVLPADADPESIAIQHHVEAPEAAIMTADLPEEAPAADAGVVTVADNTSATDGEVEAVSTDVVAAFEVDSFSYFTITYKGKQEIFTMKVYLATDEFSGDIGQAEIPLPQNYDLTGETKITDILKYSNKNSKEVIDLATYSYNGKVYSFSYAITAKNRYVLDAINYNKNSNQWEFRSGNNWYGFATYGETAIRLIYKEATEQTAFYYVLNPAKGKATLGVFENIGIDNQQWLYFGSGQIYRDKNPGTGEFYSYDSHQAKPDTLKYPDTITMRDEKGDLVKYRYEGLLAGKTQAEIDKEYQDANGLFYDVTWVRFAATGGQTHPGTPASNTNAANNSWLNEKDEYNGEKGTNAGKVWHVDGYLVLRPKVQVKYYILDETLQGARLPELGSDGFYAGSILDEGGYAEQMRFTSDTELYGHLDFNNWFTDKECTKPWVFTDKVEKDLVLYHKLTIEQPTSYSLVVGKVMGNKNDTTTPLKQLPGLTGAEFTIYDKDNKEITVLKPSKPSGTEGMAVATTGEANVFLEFDKVYRLEETATPTGYNQLAEPIYFKAVTTQVNGEWEMTLSICDSEGNTVTADGTPVKYEGAEVDNETLTLIVANYGGYVLPSTGGAGTLMYTLGGGMLMMACAIALVYKTSLRKEGRRK